MMEQHLSKRAKIQLMLNYLERVQNSYSRSDLMAIGISAKQTLVKGSLFDTVVLAIEKKADDRGYNQSEES